MKSVIMKKIIIEKNWLASQSFENLFIIQYFSWHKAYLQNPVLENLIASLIIGLDPLTG